MVVEPQDQCTATEQQSLEVTNAHPYRCWWLFLGDRVKGPNNIMESWLVTGCFAFFSVEFAFSCWLLWLADFASVIASLTCCLLFFLAENAATERRRS